MTLLDGKATATTIKAAIAKEVINVKQQTGRVPHLAAVLVGDNPASKAYVRNKVQSCEEVGFSSTLIKLAEEISQEELLRVVKKLNEDDEIDGFIVQLPLPKHINEEVVTLAIDPRKDVDGFHPTNFGRMALGLPAYLPATPFGILLLLEHYNIQTAGKHCVVVGRSNIVGTPISLLLSRKGKLGDCTVTLAHSRTRNLSAQTLQADILIAAIGIPRFITADMVHEGAIVIDVGINRLQDATTKTGSALVGDVDFEGVSKKASYITPVPGGVGQMTVAALMMNTLKACKNEVYAKA